MADFNIVNNNDFMIEKIKERPINRRKLMRRTVITASMAVIFGLVACFTFLLLEPIISNILYPEEKTTRVEIFPEEEVDEEMEPEDMLADNLPENQMKEEESAQQSAMPQLNQKQIDEILSSVDLDKSDYVHLYEVMDEYVEELEKSLVVVTGVKENYDWMENSYESTNEVPGIVVANSKGTIYILTYAQAIRKADKIQVTFQNKRSVDASLVQKHSATDLAVISVEESLAVPQGTENNIKVASFGSSKVLNIKGSPVVALGSLTGIIDSVAYGMVTAVSEGIAVGDFAYDILTTDIYGSQTGRGFLFNMNGQVIGIYNTKSTNAEMRNIVSAFGISDLKMLITRLSSGEQVSYLGITGISVPEKVNKEQQIPNGAYVTDVVMNSPAMLAGLQEGDIIIGAGETTIKNYADLERVLYNTDAGQTIKIKIMRQSQESYKEMDMDVVLSKAD